MKTSINILTSFVLLLSSTIATTSPLDDFNVIYINGVITSKQQAQLSAEATSGILGEQKSKVISRHNSTRGLLIDLIETYGVAAYDGTKNGKNYTPFWKWLRNKGSDPGIPEAFKQAYWQAIATMPQEANPDLNAIQAYIENLQQTKKKTLIISHSEGNFFSNIITERIKQNNPDIGGKCMGVVAVATPATHVANNGPWVTANKDIVIGAARLGLPYGDNILPSNINTLISYDDLLGHGYKEIYIKQAGSDIASSVSALVSKINTDCPPTNPVPLQCGVPTHSSGTQANNQHFAHTVSGPQQQKIIVSAEAFFTVLNLKVKAAGHTFVDESFRGFKQFAFDFDTNLHSNTIDVYIDTSSNWEFSINCDNPSSLCPLVPSRKEVIFSFYKGDIWWECSNNIGMAVDGWPLTGSFGGAKVVLTPGQHQFTWSGACSCRFSPVACNSNPPKIYISGRPYPLPNNSLGSPGLIFTVQ